MTSLLASRCRKVRMPALLLGLVLFGVGAFVMTRPAVAAPGVNPQINFQGRLLNAQGATVPDGYYNIEFKIYQDGDGLTAGNTTGSPAGSLKWTEAHLNANGKGIVVKNGFLSVQLGSVTPFGTLIDWDQDTLWVSMNIGGTNASCTPFSACGPDGEMLPMKRLSANAYALNSARLGGLSASGFIQNTTTLQTANIAVQSAAAGNIGALIQGATSQTADIFQVKAAGTATPVFAIAANGTAAIRPTANTTAAFNVQTTAGGSVFVVDAANSRVGINMGASSPQLAGTGVEVNGALRLSGVVSDTFVTPVGSSVPTKINIPVYSPGNFGQILAMGVPSAAPVTARVMSLLDARTTAHQPTLAVFNPAEDQVFGLSWDGSPTNGYLKNSTDTIVLQANTLDVLTARNVSNAGRVGVNTGGVTNYTLDVGGDINTSTHYRVAGVTTLTNTALTFSGASTGLVQSAATQTLTLNGQNGLNLQTNGVNRAVFDTTGVLVLGNGTTSATPGNFLVRATGSSATGVAGATLTLQGGNATVGNANGGNLTLSGGTGIGTGAAGLVVMSTPTFSTAATDANCFTGGNLVATSCTIDQSSVNNYSAVIVGFSQDGQTAFLPNPTINTAGRVVYITASGTTKDFTLSVNGGGQGNLISMRKNTTATMIWNGSAWTAAGASSSTTLQAAYDNTLQSAGGAELVVSKTSATNGLTIRDSSASPVNGTLLSVQTSSAAGLLQVNSNVTEYASNAGAETNGGSPTTFPANTWSLVGGSTVTRYNTAGNYIATGQGSVSVVTPASAQSGVKNQLLSALSTNTTYNVSFTSRLLSGTFTDMNVYYSVDGTAASVACTAAATAITSIWTKVNCTFTTPASGIVAGNAILIRQTAASARTLYVDNLSVTIAADYNFATDGSVNDSGNFATNWSSAGAGTVSVTRNTSDGYDASDSANVNITAGAANAGLRNRLSSNPLTSTLYRITIYAKSSNAFTDFKVRYSPNGGTNYVDCVDYNTQTVSTADWTKVTCYIQTAATAVTTPYVYFVESASSVRSFGVDGFNMSISTVTTPNVQVGGGVNGGPTTLFTLDKGASAPIASDNDALLGSMYYDTTLGKLQCYEADGWGACGSSPDNIITISPEYTNAVLHGTGIGTMTSDLCSDTLNVNDGSSGQPTICGTNETYNFYKWTSPQATAQTYGIYVTYQLPSTFKSFTSGETSLMGRTDSANSTVSYQIYRNSPTGLVSCGSSITVSSGVQTAWQIGSATGAADPSTCGFSGGESIVFRINMTASQNANAYVGNLNFTFSNR